MKLLSDDEFLGGSAAGGSTLLSDDQFMGGTAQPAQRSAAPTGEFKGLIESGNIDLAKRPVVKNADGSVSTVRSISFEEDGKEILIPTVSPDGKILSDKAAIDLYRKTGNHLGKFDNADDATAYAEALHGAQADFYTGKPASGILSDDEFLGGAPAAKAEPPGFLSELKKGFVGSILNQNPQSLADALDAGAELTRPSPGTIVGSLVRPKGEPVGEFPSSRLGDAAATVRGWAQHGAEDRKASVPSFTDIRTDSLSHMFEDAASYAGYGIGSGAGSSTPSIVVGASVAAATKNPLGFFAGALGPSYAQNLGDTYATLRDDPGIQQAIKDGKLTQKRVAAIAAAVAVPIAALDAVSAEKMVGINLEELKGGIIKRVLKKVGIGALTEGGTEGLQQVIQESALAAAGGDHTLAQSAVSVIDNAVQGALSGGAISTAAAPFGNKATDKAKGTPETGIPQGAASADTLFGQESAGGPPPPSADTAAGGPPPPPAATPEKERPNSPRLTPADRASPLPNDLIDDGKKIFDEALGAGKSKTAAPLDGQIITPAQQREAARRVDDIAGEFGKPASQPAPSAIDHTIEGTLTPAEAASAPAAPARTLSDREFMASPAGASQAEVQPAVVRIDGRDFPFTGYPEAVDAYRKTIDRSGAVPRSSIAAMRGASSAPEAQFVAADGKIVAHMGYNGKVWRHGDLGPDYSKPIYDPAETAEPAPQIKGEKLTSPAAPAQANWMQSLVDDEKDAVKEQMREMAAKAQKIYDNPRNRTPSGSVAAGSEGARQALKAGAIESVLRAIRAGKTPDEAIEIAKSETQQTVKKHNARSNDIHWKVDAEAFDSEIKHTAGMLRDALKIRERATKTVKQPRSPSVENKDIVQFIAGMGGIRDYKGELRSMDLSKKFVPGMGKLVRESGSPADTVREAAAQEGYFDHIYGDPDTASQKSTVADLYRLIDDNERGNRRFTTSGQRAVEKKQADKAVVQDSEEQARQDDFAQTVKEFDLTDDETAQLQAAVDRGEWASEAVFDILERRAVAFEGETHDIRGQGEPNLDDIPFDIPQAPDARAADAPREGSSDQGRDRQGADAGAAQGSAPPRGQHGQAERAGRSEEGGEGPLAIDFEEFAAQRGSSRQDIGDAGLHSGAAHVSKTARRAAQKYQNDKDTATVARRDELRREYDLLVESGKARPLSSLERLERTARGHEDNPSVQAARRTLERRRAAASTSEPGAEGKPQTVIPGAEKISQGQQAQREADKPLRAKAPQKDAGELFDSQARSERQDELFALRREGPRQQGIPASAVSLAPFEKDADIKAHPDYRAAKDGDNAAAVRLVQAIIPDSFVQQAADSFGSGVIYAAVGAQEAGGRNKIPAQTAAYLAERTGATATGDITQTNKAFHTGARPMERLLVRADFDGEVVSGGRYVIVDDATVMGSTLADMADHIQHNGGKVVGIVTLANASRTGVLVAPKHRTQAIERRFGDVVRSELHLDPASLTAPEAGYLLNFRDADALRSGIAKARNERVDRLRAKGIQQAPEDHGEGQGRLKRASEDLQPTDTFKAQAQAVGARLRAELDRLGLKDVGLRISENLGLMVEGKLHAADGSYFRKLITVALDADNPDSVLDHEAIHALRDVGAFSPTEWAILERKSRKEWRDRYGIADAYGSFPDGVQIEEGIAHAFADWRAGRSMDGIIAKAFKKIRGILQAIGKAFGKDFRTAEDVFEQVNSGEIGNRSSQESKGEEHFKLRDPQTAEDRQKTMQGMIARGQPLDRALRLPFQFFGGVDEKGRWKPGLHLSDKAAKIITAAKIDPQGRFGWLAGPVEAARAGLIDRYGLSPEYIDRDRQRQMDERSITMRGAEVLKILAEQNVGTNEARVLQAILTGEAVSDKDMNDLAAPIRQAIDELGQEAVSLGLVSAESFERNRGAYLHRVYAKHEAEQNNLQKLVSQVMGRKRKQIIGDELKGRGLFWDVDNARLMRDIASFKDGKRGGPVLGEKFRVLDNVLSPTKDMLSGEERGKVARRVYVPADQAVPAQYTGPEWRDNGVWEVRKAGKDKVTLWRDYSQAERSKMGEILDARYTIGKTYLYMAHDLATGRFYKDIAENEDWTSSSEPGAKSVDADQFRRHWNDREVAWVKVPDSTISNTGGKKRWGALSGKWVRSEIWRDLNEIDIMNRPSTWRFLLTQWKLNKTARSPVVHMNNVMSNLMLMDMQDVRMQDLQAGIRSFINKDKHWQDANEHGVFGADMMTQEIRDNVLKPILAEIEKQGQDGVQNSFLARAGILGKFADRLWGGLKFADKKMRDLYMVEDDVFRLASYRAGIARGESPEHAAAAAREQFLDYDIRAPWVNAARNSLLPFISYTYRAVPLIARAMATRPWKLAKYAMVAYALNALAYAWDDDGDEDKERASLRDEEQGLTWLFTPRMMRMPFRNQDGLPVFLDARRWIPGGDVFDTNQGSSAVPIPAPLQFGGPLMLAFELALNKSGFTGDPITNDLTDNWFDKTSKVGDYLWKAWLPSAAWVPNSWYWTKIENAAKGATDIKGHPYSLPEAISSSFGVKVKPQDVETGLFWHYKDIKDVEQALRAEARTLARQRDRGLISQKAFDAGMQSLLSKRDRLIDRVKELQRVQKK